MQKQLPEIQATKPTRAQLAVGIGLAVLFGLLGTALVPYLSYAPVLAFLFAYAGIVPFVICAALQVVVYQALGGLPVAVMGICASVLPGAIAVRGLRWRRSFDRQLRLDLAAQLLGIVAAVAFAYAIYGELIERIMALLEASLANYPDEFVTALLQGRFESTTALLNTVKTNLALQLPGMLFTVGIFSGVLAAAVPNWLLRRRGAVGKEAYRPLKRWRVPKQIVGGVLGMLAAGLLLYLLGLPNGTTVFATVRVICDCCFLLQALGALARFADKTNMPRAGRNVCLILAVTLLQPLATYLGCFSALFGSRGLISEWLRSRRNNIDV